MDGLYNNVTATTVLRDQVRQRLREGQKPAIDYDMLARAMEIDVAIREWDPPYAPGTEHCLKAYSHKRNLDVSLLVMERI
ncbi:hypothetical protein KEM56_002108 [Ascosphaera pollenicola]|nr:hypothetical protein KEM56_002108 [Ascosphaera pollenicola]